MAVIEPTPAAPCVEKLPETPAIEATITPEPPPSLLANPLLFQLQQQRQKKINNHNQQLRKKSLSQFFL